MTAETPRAAPPRAEEAKPSEKPAEQPQERPQQEDKLLCTICGMPSCWR